MSVNQYYQPLAVLRELSEGIFPNGSFLKECTFPSAWTLKVDIKETEKEFILFADIPGIDADQLEIDMEGDTLTIQGERKLVDQEENSKDYYRLERIQGKFYRQFRLPKTVDGSNISAKTKDGVLAIHIPKIKDEKFQRKIAVQKQ